MVAYLIAMLHSHHIIPKYKGGSDKPSNLIKLTVTQHAMFHYCNWQLWNDKRDWLAWHGLIGEIGREEIIHELRLIGSAKGLLKSWTKGSTPARAAAARKNLLKATEAAQKPEVIAKRTLSLRANIACLTAEEKRRRFGRPQTPKILQQKSERLRSWKSLTIETSHGIIEVSGSIAQIAEQLSIERKSMQPLLKQGKVKRLGLKLISKNPW